MELFAVGHGVWPNLLAALLAMLTVLIVHPKLVKIAKLKSIVDNPNARKLNKEPIPVLGGVGVFIGLFIAITAVGLFIDISSLQIPLAVMLIMLYVGVGDDILNMRATTKMLLQIVAVCLLMFVGDYRITSFWGLCGIHALPLWFSYLFTLVSCVGVINAVNLIDGVDGLSSGFGMLAAAVCGACFVYCGDEVYAALCFATVGALLPFFLHNVFGRTSKMFIGDGGSLVLGMLFSVVIVHILGTASIAVEFSSPVAFLLAVFTVPVFDTTRVMLARISKGVSPFHPDKTHLHHAFIEAGFSHADTTLIIVLLDMLVIGSWYLASLFLSQFWQVVVVAVCGLLVVCTPPMLVGYAKRRNPKRFERHRDRRKRNHERRRGFYFVCSKFIDSL